MIDIFTGVIVASWSHMIAQMLTRPLDQWLMLPPRPIVPRGYARLRLCGKQAATCSGVSNEDLQRTPSTTSMKNSHPQDNNSCTSEEYNSTESLVLTGKTTSSILELYTKQGNDESQGENRNLPR